MGVVLTIAIALAANGNIEQKEIRHGMICSAPKLTQVGGSVRECLPMKKKYEEVR